MKIAILLAGPYRGSTQILENHLQFIGEYDIYVSCFEHYKNDWINSGWPIKKLFITPTINFNETNWSKYRNDLAGQSGFWQFWNLRNVILNVDKDYDWYIKNRCDLLFNTNVITSDFFENLKPNTLYAPSNMFNSNTWNDNAINDQFYIGDYTVMKVVSEFSINYYDTFRHQLNAGGNENCLKNWLDDNNILIEPVSFIKYTKDFNGYQYPTGNDINQYQLENF